jgi:ribonuclease HI
MKLDPTYIYCDASFSKIFQVAVVGSLIFQNEHDHQHISAAEAKINLTQIRETNNIRAEIKGVILALQTCQTDDQTEYQEDGQTNYHTDGQKQSNKPNHCQTKQPVILFTDCQTLSELMRRRKHLEKTNFISKNKNTELANADLYKEFYLLYDKIQPEIHWVKGHTEKSSQTAQQKNFSFVDKEVRLKLRAVVAALS